jgi:signal peptidase I
MEDIVNTIKAIATGVKEGLLDLVNWNRPAREKPAEREDSSWQKYFKYPEWRIWSITEVTAQIVVVLILLIIIRQGIGEFRFIPSESMEPTLVKGDKLCVEKLSRLVNKNYQRGDVVIFYPPPAAKDGEEVIKYDPFNWIARMTGLPFLPQPEAFIKRIIGVPGDRIKVVKNQGVYVNNQPLVEPYHHNSVDYLPEYSTDEIEVPEGFYYVLGDNRNYSYDSHYWGLLDEKRVIGRAAFLIYRSLDNKPEIRTVERKN